MADAASTTPAPSSAKVVSWAARVGCGRTRPRSSGARLPLCPRAGPDELLELHGEVAVEQPVETGEHELDAQHQLDQGAGG
jgi:hypothetical protein